MERGPLSWLLMIFEEGECEGLCFHVSGWIGGKWYVMHAMLRRHFRPILR